MNGQGPKSTPAHSGLEAFAALEQGVLDAVPTGLALCGPDGCLVRYNTRAAELWGRAPRLGDPAERSTGSFRRFSADGAPLPFEASPVAHVLRTGKRVVGAELVIERPDGSHTPVLMNVV